MAKKLGKLRGLSDRTRARTQNHGHQSHLTTFITVHLPYRYSVFVQTSSY